MEPQIYIFTAFTVLAIALFLAVAGSLRMHRRMARQQAERDTAEARRIAAEICSDRLGDAVSAAADAEVARQVRVRTEARTREYRGADIGTASFLSTADFGSCGGDGGGSCD